MKPSRLPDNIDSLLSKGAVAALLDTSTRTLQRMVQTQKFPKPTHRIGTQSRWRRSVVEGWINDGQPNG